MERQLQGGIDPWWSGNTGAAGAGQQTTHPASIRPRVIHVFNRIVKFLRVGKDSPARFTGDQ
ncbi:hypothetical protein RHOFW104T7_10415 [Rhodanobacter thiooxydans]|uniref:Uncharacterized protein n=1 Tax=Rhodanobacter thiooxydans TaxID=416169 RepID=A0A154QJV2_9GAMM|nr:hypothetical protein RHOFW104T7_10415 [Rhodanobacter thiooxydans]